MKEMDNVEREKEVSSARSFFSSTGLSLKRKERRDSMCIFLFFDRWWLLLFFFTPKTRPMCEKALRCKGLLQSL
ncbi:hypothetical protein CSUI_003853 [Cystoisospora suis]|uniref:Uncharacterized protein n=1 Tax=Cystoisospora suis TaxID=483139 RepID=A0A2C6KE50_9APIC|nr:hypothetical protein CSUI_003853 [Cystoisospora suis]